MLLEEPISRDEGMHCNFACLLYSKMVNHLPEGQIVEIITNTVKIEKEFVSDGLPVELIGMNSSLMCEYIEFCTDCQPIRMDGNNQFKGKDKLLQKTCWRT